jgi:hypothetical protein
MQRGVPLRLHHWVAQLWVACRVHRLALRSTAAAWVRRLVATPACYSLLFILPCHQQTTLPAHTSASCEQGAQ